MRADQLLSGPFSYGAPSHPVPASAEAGMPRGPWVLVVGMHRSGTSALTGALGHLGLMPPIESDRWEPSDDNPDHFESRALGLYSDRLLERLGGTWDRPPDPVFEWEPDRDLEDVGNPAGPARTAFPHTGPVVWKDPRSCLLLPYWLAHLPKPVAAVFIWRSPLSVARSLHARDRMQLPDGVALWERYNRTGLAGLMGVSTFVTRYESIVEDPFGRLGDVAAWLGNLPQLAVHAPRRDLPAAVASISPRLLHEKDSGESDLLLDEQRQLVELLESLDGPHCPLASLPLGTESPWTTALLGDRHQLAVLSTQRDTLRESVTQQRWEMQRLAAELAARQAHVEALEGELEGMRAALTAELSAQLTAEWGDELSAMNELNERMRASTSWRITEPLRKISSLRGPRATTRLRG